MNDTWRVKSATVRIERQPTGILSARVVQKAADGEVQGRNLLTGRQITKADTAKIFCQSELVDKISAINWELRET